MNRTRLIIIPLFFLAFGALIIARLFSIQISQAQVFQLRAQRQQQINSNQRRGDIFGQDKDHNRFLLATTKSFLRLYVVPKNLLSASIPEVANLLTSQLSLPSDVVQERLSHKEQSYVPLKDHIAKEEKVHVRQLIAQFSDALKVEEYQDRFYPYGTLGAQAIGFVGFVDQNKTGLYGIEKFYDKELAAGNDLVLTLDINVQRSIESTLHDLMEKWKTLSGSIIVMRPRDGAILAMASEPNFDPNDYASVKDIGYFLNPITQKVFEPGSIMKPITMSAGLELGKITPDTTYVDRGVVEVGGYKIRNAGDRTFGLRTMKEVLEFSINTGAIFVEQLVGQKDFLRNFENFGLGQATGIDLPGEAVGDMTNLDSGRPVNYATASFGQGISTTPLQMLDALSAIANEGKLMRPYVLERMAGLDGSSQATLPKVRKVSIKQDTAARVVQMLTEVVDKGYDKKARVPGFVVAGKTGTSEIPSPKGGYLNETIHSFEGFAPAFDPAFILLIKLDEPLGTRFASESIAPSFSKLTQSLLQYYGKLPDRPTN